MQMRSWAQHIKALPHAGFREKRARGRGNFSKFCKQSRALLLIRLGLTVIHELRNEDAGGGGQLEHEVEGATQLGRRNL